MQIICFFDASKAEDYGTRTDNKDDSDKLNQWQEFMQENPPLQIITNVGATLESGNDYKSGEATPQSELTEANAFSSALRSPQTNPLLISPDSDISLAISDSSIVSKPPISDEELQNPPIREEPFLNLPMSDELMLNPPMSDENSLNLNSVQKVKSVFDLDWAWLREEERTAGKSVLSKG